MRVSVNASVLGVERKKQARFQDFMNKDTKSYDASLICIGGDCKKQAHSKEYTPWRTGSYAHYQCQPDHVRPLEHGIISTNDRPISYLCSILDNQRTAQSAKASDHEANPHWDTAVSKRVQ